MFLSCSYFDLLYIIVFESFLNWVIPRVMKSWCQCLKAILFVSWSYKTACITWNDHFYKMPKTLANMIPLCIHTLQSWWVFLYLERLGQTLCFINPNSDLRAWGLSTIGWSGRTLKDFMELARSVANTIDEEEK